MKNFLHNSICRDKFVIQPKSGGLPRETFRRSGGFSLVEILIVTSVVTVGFIAVLSLIRNAIIVYYNNQNYLSAATVAQQGLELTRYIRDDNWLAGAPFTTNISQKAEEGVRTIFAIDQQAMVDPANANRAKIVQFYNSVDGNKLLDFIDSDFGINSYVKNPSAKIYFAEGNNNFYAVKPNLAEVTNLDKSTIFHNLIQTTYHDNGTPDDKEDDYLYVVSTVYWQDRGADKYFSLSTYLYDYSWKY